jgi:hypothetical protein
VNGKLGKVTLQYGDHVLQHIKHTFAGYVYFLTCPEGKCVTYGNGANIT